MDPGSDRSLRGRGKIWNLKMRQFQITDLPFQNQLFLEGYIQENIPQNRRVYTWFDVYDLEEGVI